jgi:thioredoxin 1
MSKPVEISDATFEQEVIESDVPVVVDFWAAWCGPCKMIAPVLEEIAENYNGKIKVAKMDVDVNTKVASQFRIMSIPTLLIFRGGELVEQVVGALPRAQLLDKITRVVG